jgi:hypothetical protein
MNLKLLISMFTTLSQWNCGPVTPPQAPSLKSGDNFDVLVKEEALTPELAEDPYVEGDPSTDEPVSAEATDIGGDDGVEPTPDPEPPVFLSEEFVAGVGSELDFLVVMDNTQGMAEIQARVGNQFANLMAGSENINWQIAVASTDPNDNCILDLFDYMEMDPETRFAESLLLGEGGATNEMGIKTATEALKSDCTTDSWIRQQSSIGVLIISTEDHCNTQSAGCPNDPWATEAYLLDYLSTIRSLDLDAVVNGLIWQPETPAAECADADFQGIVYDKAIEVTSGISGSICDADFSQTFSKIATRLQEMLFGHYMLSQDPDPASITILINGIEETEFISVGNRVIFEVPLNPGDQISITFAPVQGSSL